MAWAWMGVGADSQLVQRGIEEARRGRTRENYPIVKSFKMPRPRGMRVHAAWGLRGGERPACPGVDANLRSARQVGLKSPSRGRRANCRTKAAWRACGLCDPQSQARSLAEPQDRRGAPQALTARWPWKRWRSSVFRSLPVAVCGRRSTNTTSSGIRHFASLVRQEIEDRLLGRRRSLARMDDQQRPLLPVRMLDGDHRGLEHVGVRHGEVLDLDRGNPFAAGLDDVLQPVGELHVAVGVDRADVAGAEPAVARRRPCRPRP